MQQIFTHIEKEKDKVCRNRRTRRNSTSGALWIQAKTIRANNIQEAGHSQHGHHGFTWATQGRPVSEWKANSNHQGQHQALCRNFNLPLSCDTGAGIDICSLTTAQMYGFRIRYEEGKHTNIYDVSGNNIRIVVFTIIYLHCGKLRKPLKVNIAENLGRDGEVI